MYLEEMSTREPWRNGEGLRRGDLQWLDGAHPGGKTEGICSARAS